MWRFSSFIVEDCLVEKEKKLREHAIRLIDITTPQKPENNLTNENKNNTEQQHNQHRDRPLNSYDALMT